MNFVLRLAFGCGKMCEAHLDCREAHCASLHGKPEKIRRLFFHIYN